MIVKTKDLIVAYREDGMSYREIAEKTGVTEDYARVVWSNANKGICRDKNQKPHTDVCRYCGKRVDSLPGKRPKQFCSEKCRYAYHNREKVHKAYIRTCEHCGNEFVSFGYPKKRFCSRECQTEAARKERRHHEG